MLLRTVIGFFNTVEDIQLAVNNLENSSVNPFNLILITEFGLIDAESLRYGIEDNPIFKDLRAKISSTKYQEKGDWLNRLKIGYEPYQVPGIGPTITTGTLTTLFDPARLTSTDPEKLASSIVDMVINLGFSQNKAHLYAEAVKKGVLLLAIQTDDPHVPVIMRLLRQTDEIRHNHQLELSRNSKKSWKNDSFSLSD